MRFGRKKPRYFTGLRILLDQQNVDVSAPKAGIEMD